MTRAERENLIRAYLEGKMSSHQEHDFFINVALDAELRTELKAHRTIEDAFRKDREVDPGDILHLQGAVMATLAATSAPVAPTASGTHAREGNEPATSPAAPARRGWRLPASIALSLLAVLFFSILMVNNRSGSDAGGAIGVDRTPAGAASRRPAVDPHPANTSATAAPAVTAPMIRQEIPSVAPSAVQPVSGSEPAARQPRIPAEPRAARRSAPSEMATDVQNDDISRPAEQSAEADPQRAEDSLGIGIDLRIGGDR